MCLDNPEEAGDQTVTAFVVSLIRNLCARLHETLHLHCFNLFLNLKSIEIPCRHLPSCSKPLTLSHCFIPEENILTMGRSPSLSSHPLLSFFPLTPSYPMAPCSCPTSVSAVTSDLISTAIWDRHSRSYTCCFRPYPIHYCTAHRIGPFNYI